MKIKNLIIIFILCVWYDIAITYYGINYYGFSEMNPFLKDLVYNNYILASFLKMGITFLCIGIALKAIQIFKIENTYIKYMPFVLMMAIQIIFNINNTLLVLGWD